MKGRRNCLHGEFTRTWVEKGSMQSLAMQFPFAAILFIFLLPLLFPFLHFFLCIHLRFPSYFAGAFPFFCFEEEGGGGLEFGGELTKRKINIGKPIDGGRMPSSAPEVDVAATAAVAVAVATLGAAAVASAACGHFSSRVSVRCAFR